MPVYKDLHQLGLPLLRSAKIHVLINILSFILCTGFLGEYILKNKGTTKFILSLIFSSLSIFDLWIYSINQGSNLIIVSLVFSIPFFFLWLKRMNLGSVVSIKMFLLVGGFVLAVLIPFVFLQIPTMRAGILPKGLDLVSEITLGADISWIITLAVFLSSLVRGIFGMGVDTYSISYYLYKPQNENLLAFNRATFYYANSELFTQLANVGIFWFLVWIFIGFLVFKSFWEDYKNIKMYGDNPNSLRLLTINLAILIIYLSSFLLSYTVLVFLLLLILVAIKSVIKDSLKKGVEDKFIIKFWAVDFSSSVKKTNSFYRFNIFFTVIVSFVVLGISWLWVSKGISSVYALKAESFFVEQNEKYQGDLSPTLEEREAFVTSMSHYYSRAINFDKNNSIYNRRLAAVYLERLGITIEKYSQLEDDENMKYQLMQDITVWKNLTVDSTRKSIDNSPFVYSNWESKVIVYTGLLSLGFYDYVPDAINTFEKALELNPLNFELHYGLAQIYLTKNEQDRALVSLAKVLEINSQHIPSILLMGDIFRSRGDIEVYESYLKAAKKILEAQGNTNSDYYVEINKELRILENQEDEENEETVEIVDVEIEGVDILE
jgi:tetratricopeptide (TPR) repeat protein